MMGTERGLKSKCTILNAFLRKWLIFLLRALKCNIQIREQQLKWDLMKAFKSIFCLSRLMWSAIRRRILIFLWTILQIFLISSLNYNSESNIVPSIISLRLNVTLQKELLFMDLNRTLLFPGSSFRWLSSYHLKLFWQFFEVRWLQEDLLHKNRESCHPYIY